MNPQLKGFAPIAGTNPRVLILGSMPSVRSLEKQEYYGHPQNAFWPIQFALAGQELSADYRKRCELLENRGIALWDVLRSCNREGSLDSAIRDPVPNDIPGLLERNPTIRLILLNGKSVEKLYLKSFGDSIRTEWLVMPSTSPAYTLSFGKKLEAWSVLNSVLRENMQ